jgi:hypothetical protein
MPSWVNCLASAGLSFRGSGRLVAGLVLLLSLAGPAARADGPSPASGVWPLSPRPVVVAGFAPPATRWGAGHRGVDLAGNPAQAVRASQPGRVVFAGRIAGRGVVVVDHGVTRSTYEPVSATVQVGDRVRAGAVVGRLQLFGSHCFPRWCLHWGLIEGGDHYLDPLTLVGAAPVVLLPLFSGPTFPGLPRAPTAPEPFTLAPTAPGSAGLGPTLGPPDVGPTGSSPLGLAQARGWAWR